MPAHSPVLVADIGGTNARFALADIRAGHPRLSSVRSLPAADFASLQHAAEHYLADCGARPEAAAFAVACPVQGDDVHRINRAWAFSQRELQASLGLREQLVLNDFGAAALAALAIGDDERVVLHGAADRQRQGPITHPVPARQRVPRTLPGQGPLRRLPGIGVGARDHARQSRPDRRGGGLATTPGALNGIR